MARNKLSDLNNHLFEMLERLNDDELEEEELAKEVRRADAMNKVAKTVIDNAQLQLDAVKHADEYGYNSIERTKRELPRIMGIDSEVGE